MALLVAVWTGRGAAWTVSPAGDAVTPELGSTDASELSAITWVSGSQFYAVSDKMARLFPLSIDVEPNSGEISGAMASAPIHLAGSDLEGLALAADGTSVWVSDETGPTLQRFPLSGGAASATVSLPAAFASARTNLSLEALARDGHSGELWTANEEALTGDGPVSQFSTGTTVRLQRFDANGVANGQWAYVTDPIPGDFFMPGRDVEASGVADVAVLPNGDLAVLERAFGAETIFRSRLYRVDRSDATDTTALGSLSGESFTPVSKTLLWENNYSTGNFEGITVGPRLANGDHALVLVSDNGGFIDQWILALRLSTCAAEPRNDCLEPGASRLRVRRLGSKRDTLSWSWRKGNIASAAQFGDPTASTAYSLCIYDSSSGVAHLAGSARIEPGNAWSALRRGGFKYRDRKATVDGVKAITLLPSPTKGRIAVRAGGLNLRLPTQSEPNRLLRRDPTVVVQLVQESAPHGCFGATYSNASRETAQRFAAAF